MDTCGNKIFSIFYPKETKNETRDFSSSKEFKEFERARKNVQREKFTETSTVTGSDTSADVLDTDKKSNSNSVTDNCSSVSGSNQFFATSGVVFYPYYYSNSYNNRYSFRYSSSYGIRGRSVYRIRR
jgi:hypothetical protein